MISAVVLAAGRSERMGKPKMILPWGDTTVIGRVVRTLKAGGVDEVLVVTGGARGDVEKALSKFQVRTVYNPKYATREMLCTIQVGISALGEDVVGALVVLGDQPQMRVEVVQSVLTAFREEEGPLVVPSYRMRRGHPLMVARSLWPEVMAIKHPKTMRDFLETHAEDIHYLEVDTPTVLLDLDTLSDYRQYRPG